MKSRSDELPTENSHSICCTGTKHTSSPRMIDEVALTPRSLACSDSYQK